MHRTFCAIVTLLLAVAAPAVAQGTVRTGESVTGALSPTDTATERGAFFDEWEFLATEGTTYLITLRSSDFNAYLEARPRGDVDCNPCEWDNDGLGGTDARVVLTPKASGPHVIRAGSSYGGERGRYTLRVEEADPATTPSTYAVRMGDTVMPGARPLTANVLVRGELREGDPERGNSAYEHAWTYQGRAGERVVFTMTSREFITYLRVGRRAGPEWDKLQYDDLSDDGTSVVELTLPEDGVYEVRASASMHEEAGRYTLVARSGDAPVVVTDPADTLSYPILRENKSQNGRLEEGDTRGEDGGFVDVWQFEGTAGDSVSIFLASDEFDAVLRVQMMTEDGPVDLGGDDDSGGRNNADARVTLPRDGTYLVRASAKVPGTGGAYRLVL